MSLRPTKDSSRPKHRLWQVLLVRFLASAAVGVALTLIAGWVLGWRPGPPAEGDSNLLRWLNDPTPLPTTSLLMLIFIVALVTVAAVACAWPLLWLIRVRPAGRVATFAPVLGLVSIYLVHTMGSGGPIRIDLVIAIIAAAYGVAAVVTTPRR